jgi:hypothetical protein
MNYYYAKAINYLQQDLDWRSLCFELASSYPKAFCDAVEKTPSPPLTPAALSMEIVKTLDGLIGNKIKAIKRYRELTGCGLAESKDEVEKIMVSLSARGLLS